VGGFGYGYEALRIRVKQVFFVPALWSLGFKYC
jgi:hypothetical protein